MLRRRILNALTVAGHGVCLLAPGVAAQSVGLEGGILSIRDSDGNRTWAAGFSGSSVAGGSGSCGSQQIKNQDDVLTVFSTCLGNLFLGGGNEDGDIHLTDTDGVTTTVSLDGQRGLAELGSADDDGDLWIWNQNTDNQRAIDLNGATATATQELGGNGFVKAWAKIDQDGNVVSCYRCNLLPAETRRLDTGTYEVSFSPLGVDIRERPRLAIVDKHDGGLHFPAITILGTNNGDTTSVWVETWNLDGNHSDRPFTLFIF